MTLDVISVNFWQIVISLLNLTIMFLILKKFLFKPVMKMFAERENEIGSMYEKAEEAQKSAEAMESEYTQKLSAAKEEASRIMKDATHEATLRGEQIVADAQQKASAITTKAQKEIEREKEAAVKEIKEDIASIAVQLAEKVIEKDLTDKDHERLLEEFIESSGENK